jgi:hypothetical protein
MKSGQGLFAFLAILAIGIIPADIFYTSRFVPRFKNLEKERIVISNQLATAKIVSENLDHVRDLVFRNMVFPGQKDSVTHETVIFDFLTTCVNDLKMRIVSVRPLLPIEEGRVTTYGYDIQLEGDFFSLGELCSKLESSQRVMALTSFDVSHTGAKGRSDAKGKTSPSGRHGVVIKMHLDTFRVKKT